MTPGPAVIDLGEVGDAPEPAHPRRRWRPHGLRRWLPAALVAALVAPLTAAAAPPGTPLTPLWTVKGTATGSIAVAGHTLYAVTRADQGTVLARYELADGAVQWTARLAGGPERSSVVLAAGVPAVATLRMDGTGVVTAYDPATGQPRWRHAGWPSRTVTGGRLVLDQRSTGPRGEDEALPSDLVAIDVDTGEIAWTIRTRGNEQELYGWAGYPGSGADPEPTDLVTLGYDGRLTRYDLATGAALATADLPAGQPYYPSVGGSVPAALFAQLRAWVFASELAHPAVADGLLTLNEPAGAVTAYDLATLAPRWRLSGHRWAAPCGPVVCAVSDDLSELAGVDPVTGSARWSWSCREHGAVGDCYVLPTAQGPRDPMLLQQWQLGRGGTDTAWLVEPTTGAAVAELGQWRALGRLDGESWLLRWVDEDEPVFGRGVPPERTWLARLTVDPIEMEVLGSIDAAGCLPPHTYLVCWPGGQADAVVWHVN